MIAMLRRVADVELSPCFMVTRSGTISKVPTDLASYVSDDDDYTVRKNKNKWIDDGQVMKNLGAMPY
jgi:hypothetical protein